MRRLLLVLALPLVAPSRPTTWHCSDYHPKLSHLEVDIQPGRTDSIDVRYWRRFPGDSVPTNKLPSRCRVRWVQVPPVLPEVTLTPAATLPLSRSRVYVSAMGTAVAGMQVRITTEVYYQ